MQTHTEQAISDNFIVRNAFRRVADRLNAMPSGEFLLKLNSHRGSEFSRALLESALVPVSSNATATPFPAPETLTLDGMTLRKLHTQDGPALLSHWGMDKNVFQFLSSGMVDTPERMDRMLTNSMEAWELGRYFRYAILNDDALPVGVLTLTPHTRWAGMLEIGMSLGSAFWKKGYGSVALMGVSRFIRRQAPQLNVFSTCLEGSPGRALLDRCGFRYQGALPRASVYHNGVNPDALCHLYTLDALDI